MTAMIGRAPGRNDLSGTGVASMRRFSLACLLMTFGLMAASADEPKPLKLLFLGDNGHHKPAERFRQLQPVLAKRGIDLTYTDKVEALSPKILDGYDGL